MGHNKDNPNQNWEIPTLAKARGDSSSHWMPSQGLTTLGAEQTAQQLPKQLFLFCVLSIWLKLGKSVHFLTWKVFKTPKGLGQEGNIPTPAKSFTVVKKKKKASKKFNHKSASGNAWTHSGEVVICLSVANSSFLEPTAAVTLQKDIFPFSWRVMKNFKAKQMTKYLLHLSAFWLFLPCARHMPSRLPRQHLNF